MIWIVLTQLATMTVSLKVKFSTYNKFYKSIGDKGYKISGDKIETILNEQPKEDGKASNLICFLIPGVNIIYSLNRKKKCIDQLKESIKENDALVPMSDYEKIRYKQLPSTISKASYVCYSDVIGKQVEAKMNNIKVFLGDEKVVLEDNIAQLYYDRLPPIAYTLEEVKKLSEVIDSSYKLGKMDGINTAIIGLPNDCEIKKTILKKEDSLKKYDYEQMDEKDIKNEKFIIYPFGIDFNENDKLKACYQEIVDERDNYYKNRKSEIMTYNIYATEDKPIVRVKRK